MSFDPQDHYFKLAKKEWYVARSAYKLQEIDQKFGFFDKKHTKSVIDIWCAPWSRIQYIQRQVPSATILWFDLKSCDVPSPTTYTYQQDIEEQDAVKAILQSHKVQRVDVIVSDMAPNTMWHKNTDAIRSITLIESTLWMYETLLSENWKFAIKVFMGSGFEELYRELRDQYGCPKRVKLFKPKSCRKESKETYIIRV